MKERINEKILEIEEFLIFLEENIPYDLEEYKHNLSKKAICERYIEKIIEAIVDLSFLIVRYKKIIIPEETSNKEIFDILKKEQIISSELCIKLHAAKGMRNIISHEYGKIDDEVVYESLKEEIIPDTKEFINSINGAIR